MIDSLSRAAAAAVLCGAGALLVLHAPTARAQEHAAPPVIGHWDLTVRGADAAYPSWLEVTLSGNRVLVGRFLGRGGSARPISRVEWTDGTMRFAIPPQWDQEDADVHLEAHLSGDSLVGTIVSPAGTSAPFTGVRAPSLVRTKPVRWGTPIALFNGKDLSGWRTEGGASKWTVTNRILTNPASGGNLISERTFDDFKLHVEFRYPKNGNSGVYLRGRYEVQVEDSQRRDWPQPVDIGGVYGLLAPNEYAATGPGQWQTYDITLIGRRVTVVLNGKSIITDAVIPGITGGALDSNEGAPGPIMLQGDHTAVEYRVVRIVPGRE